MIKTFTVIPIIGFGYFKETLTNFDNKIEIYNIIFLCFKISIYNYSIRFFRTE